MRITFILPGIPVRPTGGTKIVLEYANRLVESYPDIQVTLCFLNDPAEKRMGKVPLPLSAKRFIGRVRSQVHPRWFPLDHRIKKRCIFAIDDASIPDADWVFATAAVTANGVAELLSCKGRKGYLIQGFETWDLPEEELRATYNLGMENITIAHWLKNVVDGATNGDCVCIPNPVDINAFHPEASIERNSCSVAVLYHTGEHKGFKYAWEAIKKAKEQMPSLQVNMFGAFASPGDLPRWVSYTRNATAEQLLDIYNRSAVYICASVNEGYGLTCVEAMACGCALVVTDFAGSREYAIAGENALVAPVRDTDAIAEDVVKLLSDKSLRERLGGEGVITAQSFSWDKAVGRFAKEVLHYCDGVECE